jgi:hypothetical protein
MTATYSYLPGYFVATFLVTYSLWLLGAWASFNARALYMPLMLCGLLIPFVLSWAMGFASGDSTLKREQLDRLYNSKRVDPKYLAV